MSDQPTLPPPSPEPPPKAPLLQRARAWLGGAQPAGAAPQNPNPTAPNRDVVIADIGKSASNVVVGKNNVQINIGGRLMTLPIWLIVVALLALVAIFAIPFVEPLLFPTQMSGGMNIAIADFGQMDKSGRIRSSALASAFSQNVYEKLIQEYQEIYPDLIGKDGRTVEIWHDSQAEGEKNLRLGIINDDGAAEDLAAKINAHIVIYGYLQEEDSGENGGQSGNQNSLHLDFYYAGETFRGEPDTVVGRHVLGEMLAFPNALASEPMAALEYLNKPLALRTRILFWLTVALIFDVTDQQQRALTTLQEAQRSLAISESADSPSADSQDKEGQALLHYFIGREAYWLREDDLAESSFNEALRLKPNYANAYIGLGALHYDRAQRYFTPNPIPPELAPCFSAQDVARGAQSPQEVTEEVDRSIAFLQQAIAMAPTSPWPPIESTAHLVLGNAYRLKGQNYLLDTQLADGSQQAQPWFTQALTELKEAERAFSAAKQQQYLSWTHLGTGATYLLQAYVALVGVNEQEKAVATRMFQAAATLFQQAADECQRCLDEGKTVADLVYQRKVIRCGCELLRDRAQVAHAEALRMLEEQE